MSHDNMTNTTNQLATTALDMQSLTTDALDMIHIMRIALLETFNPIQGQKIDEMSVIYGAYKILTKCEAQIKEVDTYLGDA